MTPGAWYAAAANPGVYVSVLQPNFIAPAILQSYRSVVNNLDSVEVHSLCYLIAFDLDRFELGYALGTEHPEVDWSDHMLPQMRDPQLPGPDGIGSIAPLISTGLIRPENGRRTVATFTGGFKRDHGAFKYGDLALENHGSHYGFIENGVVFSKLQPGLATIFVLDDGSVEMKTWTDADNTLLGRIRHARQNGVPLVEFDETSSATVPGRLVNRWGPGNWSGSEDEKLRTMRAGAALQTNHGKRFLIYAVFSDATPSAMARIFQAYRCDYAMLLDMNALEHTYLALYRRSGSQLFVDHLLKGMSELDKSARGEDVPRFLGYPDNRDFFYVMRRERKGGQTMRFSFVLAVGLLAFLACILRAQLQALREQNEILFQQLKRGSRIVGRPDDAIRKIFAKSGYMGQGNPAVTRHPVTPEAMPGQAEAGWGSITRIPGSRRFAEASTWRRSTILRRNGRKTRRSASISSNFPISPALIRSSG